jgi:hypothetical protein
MQLLLQRLETDGERLTTSALFVGRTLYGFVPEDPPREVKVKGQTRIPAGRYRLTLEDSPKFTPKYGHKMITVNGVPGFEGIRIHRGNSPADTMGCVLPNAQILVNPDGDNLFYLSTQAYDHLYKEVGEYLAAGGEAWMTVRDESFLFPNMLPPEPVSVA